MPDTRRRHIAVEVTWRTLLRLVIACALVWVWLQIWQLVLIVIVGIVLAVTLDPVVRQMQRRLPRWAAVALLGLSALVLIAGFAAMSWNSLSSQAHLLANRFGDVETEVRDSLPPVIRDAFGLKTGADAVQSYFAPLALRFFRAVMEAAVVFGLAFVLTLYLLTEGRRTYDWVLAFVPKQHRARVDVTAAECQRVIFAYVVANVMTSIFAFTFVLISLSILGVPAALLLAVIAGLCDFVPALGFIVSVLPAVVLGLTVSPPVAAVVVGLYVCYHIAENYAIAPWAYGNRLRLSNLAVILAFAAGAELAGVVGALIALPLAAAYPVIERVWLREQLGDEVVREHRAIERRRAG